MVPPVDVRVHARVHASKTPSSGEEGNLLPGETYRYTAAATEGILKTARQENESEVQTHITP